MSNANGSAKVMECTVPFAEFLLGFVVTDRCAAGQIDNDGLVAVAGCGDVVDGAEEEGQHSLRKTVLDDLHGWVSRVPTVGDEIIGAYTMQRVGFV